MAKHFLIIILFFCFQFVVQGQDRRHVRIDSLKAQLPYLKDTSRINCLISISRLLSNSNLYSDYDSVDFYAIPAIAESRKLNYRQGLCLALFWLGNNETRKNLLDCERHLKEVISIADNDSLVARARRLLGQCLWSQARYNEAIEVLKTSADYYEKKNQPTQLVDALIHLTFAYEEQGNYEKAFEYVQRCVRINKESKDTFDFIISALVMGSIYRDIGDYETARKYNKEAFQYLRPDSLRRFWATRFYFINSGELYFHLKEYDSALHMYQFASTGYPTALLYKNAFAKIYLAQKKCDSAQQLFHYVLKHTSENNDQSQRMRSLLGLGETYLNKKNYTLALHFAKQALQTAQTGGARQNIRDACLLLSSVYESFGKIADALAYYKKYNKIKDSLVTDQFKGKMYEFKRIAEDDKRTSEIELLKKQKQISEQQLKWEKQHARQNLLLKNILIGGIILILVLGLFIFRSISLKQKNEKLLNGQIQSQLQHKATDLEMQALRAQMNPHFIFNCLSSINRFILKNETEIASDYLTRFSRLIRLVLIHSQSSMILLKEEIEMLRLYLDMEQLRFKNSFDYNISFTNSIDPEIIFIPPLLLQPFCENAIWHGLMNKQGQGHLEIRLSMQDNILNCTITDNGVGRRKAAELKSKSGEKQKSLGLKITAERLALINEEKGVKTNYEIEDLLDEKGDIAGTRVILRIRYKENIKEPVKELSHTT